MKIIDTQLEINFRDTMTTNQKVSTLLSKINSYKKLHPNLTVLEVNRDLYMEIHALCVADKSCKHPNFNFNYFGLPEVFDVEIAMHQIPILKHGKDDYEILANHFERELELQKKEFITVCGEKDILQKKHTKLKQQFIEMRHKIEELNEDKKEYDKVCIENKRLQEKVEKLDKIAWDCKDR
jgi:hypothetical protein